MNRTVTITETEHNRLLQADEAVQDYVRATQRMLGYMEESRISLSRGFEEERMRGRIEALNYFNRQILEIWEERLGDGDDD